MQIKIRNYATSGSTNVQVVNPATGEVLSNLGLDGDQEITITAVTAHEPADLEVGEVAAAT